MAVSTVHRVCVVGAGSAGLSAIKNVEEYGMEVVAFEKSPHFAGIWKFKEDHCDGLGTVMKSTILNTSKEFISMSDFPCKKEDANFMRNTEVYRFLKEYSEHFDLLKHIQFSTKVISVDRTEDYDRTGKWTITYEQDGIRCVEVFDAVMVCTGHHVNPSIPSFEGMINFKGTVIHSHDYKTARPYEDRRVLVVGMGNSGGDVLCEVGKVARKTFGCSRQGTWVTQRVVQGGYPRDILLRTRYQEAVQKLIPKQLRTWLAIRNYNDRLDHSLYGLRPSENPGQSPVLLADDLPLFLASGWVELRVGIQRFTESGVYFEDGRFEEIDDVILCTGYDFDFNFVEDGKAVPVKDNQTRLWRRIFPPDHKYSTLAMIGVVDPLGPTITCCEAQSRMVSHYWANRIQLPTEVEMQREIDADKSATKARFKCSDRRASLQIDHIFYFDQLASMIGALPDLSWNLFFKDPQLALALHLGPVTSHQYRIRGPNVWPLARQQLLGTYDRVHYGMNTRLRPQLEKSFQENFPTVYSHLLPILAIDALKLFLIFLVFAGLFEIFFD